MYFVRYGPLKEKLRTRTLTEREALPYFIVFMIGIALGTAIPADHEMNRWDWISGVGSVLIVVPGVWYAYVKNGGSSGQDLILKYVVLSWVVVFRCLPFLIFIIFACAVASYAWDPGLSGEQTGPWDVAILLAFQILLYQRTGKHIGDTRN